jgi:hypothetical protein
MPPPAPAAGPVADPDAASASDAAASAWAAAERLDLTSCPTISAIAPNTITTPAPINQGARSEPVAAKAVTLVAVIMAPA